MSVYIYIYLGVSEFIYQSVNQPLFPPEIVNNAMGKALSINPTDQATDQR